MWMWDIFKEYIYVKIKGVIILKSIMVDNMNVRYSKK